MGDVERRDEGTLSATASLSAPKVTTVVDAVYSWVRLKGDRGGRNHQRVLGLMSGYGDSRGHEASR